MSKPRAAAVEFRCTYRLQLLPRISTSRRESSCRTCASSESVICTSRRRCKRARARRTATTSSTRPSSRRISAARTSSGDSAEAGLGVILDIVPNHMAASEDENPFWRDSAHPREVLRRRVAHRRRAPLLRHQRPRRRPHRGPGGVRGHAPEGDRARARGPHRRHPHRPSGRPRQSRRATSTGSASPASSTSGSRRSSSPASSSGTGRSRVRPDTSSPTTSRRCSSIPTRSRPFTEPLRRVHRR